MGWRVRVLALAGLLLAGCASGSHNRAGAGSRSASSQGSPRQASYGALPSFLPTAAVHPDSVLTATAERPALTTEGDSVLVHAAHSAALATITGPEVPGEGLPYQAETTTCTWTVTLRATSGRVPIAVGDFTSRDHLGAAYHPTLVPGQPRPPAELPAGRATTFELRTAMPTGEGLIDWAPGGERALASWDFEVEND